MSDLIAPSWRYHPTEGAKLFQTVEELNALDASWVDSPEKFPAGEPEAADDDADPDVPAKKRGRPRKED